MQCKLVICRILDFIHSLRLDYQMAQALGLFADQVKTFAPAAFDVKTSRSLRELLTESLRLRAAGVASLSVSQVASELAAIVNDPTLSLEHLCPGQDISAVLMDLCMYQNPDLTAAALDLLGKHHLRFERLREALGTVQLLVSPSTVAAYVPTFGVGEPPVLWLCGHV